jgi:anti-anti-sigma factor
MSASLLRIEPSARPNEYQVIGEIDMSSSEALSTFLRDRAAARQPVALDLSGVSFLDSTAIHTLIAGSWFFDGSGPLELVNLSPQVRRVLEITAPHGLPMLRIEGFEEPPSAPNG